MRLDGENFHIIFDSTTRILSFFGSLRMNDMAEFEKIKKFLREAYDLDNPEILLDFTNLEFMNSAGISTLCKFIFDIKDLSPPKAVTIMGNAAILWQQKSFANLKKIWDRLEICFTGK